MDKTSIEHLLPKEIALKAENVGVIKANMNPLSTLFLSIMAGLFISLGAAFYTVIIANNGINIPMVLPFGVIKFVGGIAFSLGLILVVLAGAELFTGNILLIMAVTSKKLSVTKLLQNLSIVFAGNFIGAIGTAYLIFLANTHLNHDAAMGLSTILIASGKCKLTFFEALIRGIGCNMLVCLAIWLTLSGRTVVDKIIALLFPIAAFVTLGFEHCIANMYFIPAGLFLKNSGDNKLWSLLDKTPLFFENLTWTNFFKTNLFPVTIGNIIGGLLIGIFYWVIYCHSDLMKYEKKDDLLKKYITKGRRIFKRTRVKGSIALHLNSHTIHGEIINISEGGALCLFNGKDILQDESGTLSADFEFADRKIRISGLEILTVRVDPYNELKKRSRIAFKFTDSDIAVKNKIADIIDQMNKR